MNGSKILDQPLRQPQSIRLLFLCPKGSLDSGGVVSNFQLIKHLVEEGFEVKVITSWRGDYNQVLTKIGIKNLAIDYNWWMPRDTPRNISNRVINAVAKIVNTIKDFDPDVIITNTSHIPWGAFAASMTNTPHVWIVREYPIKNFEYLTDKVDFIKRYSNKIMANSQELASYYQKNHNCIVGRFLSYVDIENIQLGERQGSVRLVSPNYMSEGKNQIDLIQAAGIVRSRRKDLNFRILLMGEKERDYWPKLEASFEENGVADIVEVYDRVVDPWKMVSDQDILVQTSLSESIGRTTTEAMKLGVAVVASDIPGHREAFRLGGGTLYQTKNPRDLAEKIEYILDHPAESRKKAIKAKQRALRNMSSEASNGPFVRALREIVGCDNPVGENRHMWPYLEYYIKSMNQRVEEMNIDLVKKNADTDILMHALDDIRNSRAYKLGRVQTGALKKVRNLIRKLGI